MRPWSSIRSSPQHEALVQHQALRQHQAWQPHLSDAPEHTQAAPEQQDNSSGRRCICGNHLRSSSSWGLFQVKERRGGTCGGGSGAVGTLPSSASSPWGLCSPALSRAPGQCPSRFTVALISQAQVLSCLPVRRGRGLGTFSPRSGAERIRGGQPGPSGRRGRG